MLYNFLLCEVPQILSAYVILLWSFFTPFLCITQLFNQPVLSQIRNFIMPTVYKVFFFFKFDDVTALPTVYFMKVI